MARGIWRRRKEKGKPVELYVEYRDSTGQRHRDRVGFETPENLRLAKELLARKQVESFERPRQQGPARRLTFRDLGENYWRLLGAQKSGTWRCMLDLLAQDFGQSLADELTTKDFQEFYNRKLQTRSASTANRYLTLIKTVYNRAIEWGDIKGPNPANGVRRKPENPSRLRYLSLKEWEAFLTVCQRPRFARLYPVVACALFTGMRRGEIMALDWQNINLEHGTIYILHSKSGKPREIPIAAKFREVLLALSPKTAGPVFAVPDITCRRLFDLARIQSRLPYFRFHDLRHSFASQFAMKTNDLLALQRILGHASPQMTQRYAHLSRGHLDAAIKQFDAAMPELDGPYLGNPPQPYRRMPHIASI